MGADDSDGNIVKVDRFTDAAGQHHGEAYFKLPADAFRNKQYLEWILAPKSEIETTVEDFTDLLNEKLKNTIKVAELNNIEVNSAKTTAKLEQLQSQYSAEQLKNMTPSDFLKLYKSA